MYVHIWHCNFSNQFLLTTYIYQFKEKWQNWFRNFTVAYRKSVKLIILERRQDLKGSLLIISMFQFKFGCYRKSSNKYSTLNHRLHGRYHISWMTIQDKGWARKQKNCSRSIHGLHILSPDSIWRSCLTSIGNPTVDSRNIVFSPWWVFLYRYNGIFIMNLTTFILYQEIKLLTCWSLKP